MHAQAHLAQPHQFTQLHLPHCSTPTSTVLMTFTRKLPASWALSPSSPCALPQLPARPRWQRRRCLWTRMPLPPQARPMPSVYCPALIQQPQNPLTRLAVCAHGGRPPPSGSQHITARRSSSLPSTLYPIRPQPTPSHPPSTPSDPSPYCASYPPPHPTPVMIDEDPCSMATAVCTRRIGW